MKRKSFLSLNTTNSYFYENGFCISCVISTVFIGLEEPAASRTFAGKIKSQQLENLTIGAWGWQYFRENRLNLDFRSNSKLCYFRWNSEMPFFANIQENSKQNKCFQKYILLSILLLTRQSLEFSWKNHFFGRIRLDTDLRYCNTFSQQNLIESESK